MRMKRGWMIGLLLTGCAFGHSYPAVPSFMVIADHFRYPGDSLQVVSYRPVESSVQLTLRNRTSGRQVQRTLVLVPNATASIILDPNLLESLAATGDLTPIVADLGDDKEIDGTEFAILGDRSIQLPGVGRLAIGTVPGMNQDWHESTSTSSLDADFRALVESWHGSSISTDVTPIERHAVSHSDWVPEGIPFLRYLATGSFPKVAVPSIYLAERTERVVVPRAIEAIYTKTDNPALLSLTVIPLP